MYVRIFCALLCFSFLLTGCGNNNTSSPAESPTITKFAPTNASAGTTITITGTNFSTILANNSVSFNGTDAVITSCSTTQIVTTVPASSTTGPITVTVGSNKATSLTNFTVMPPWIGTKQLGSAIDNFSRAVVVDANGNVYVTGADSDSKIGDWDMVLVKYDSSGTYLWTRQLVNAVGTVEGVNVAVDNSGNVYVTGYARTGYTTVGLDGNTNAGGCDIFLVKYDSTGNKQWTRQMGSSVDDYGLSIVVDSNGDAYVSGFTFAGLDENTNAGGCDIFLVKYDSAGNKQWTRQMGSTGSDSGPSVAMDSSGNIYIAGSTNGNLDGNTNSGGYDAFLVKYNPSGIKRWTRQFGTTNEDFASGVSVDGSGNVYVSGSTYGGFDGNTNAGAEDIFLVKYDPAGNTQWTRQLGSAGYDVGFDVTVDGSNNIYVTGATDGGLVGNTNAGGDDIVLVKYDSAGNRQWLRQLGSAGNDKSTGVAVDGSGNIFVTGNTNSGLDGNTNAGGDDIFLMKLNPSGVKQ